MILLVFLLAVLLKWVVFSAMAIGTYRCLDYLWTQFNATWKSKP